jgi:thiamine biosynthesis protein ThiS
MGEAVEITVNGEQRRIDAGTTVAALVASLGYGDRPVAVERNLEVVPRARHAACVIESGDRIEIVVFVGGG